MSTDDKPDKERLEALERATQALPKSVEPKRDLWPGIRARIMTERTAVKHERRGGWMPFMVWRFAAVLMLMAASSLVTLWVTKLQTDDPILAANYPAAFGGEYVLGPNYIEARNELTVTLQDRLGRLSPETRKIVEDNLKEIQDALNEINEALVKDPNNALLQQLLLATYQEELEMFNTVNRMTEYLPYEAET